MKNTTEQYLKGSSPWYFIASILVAIVGLGGIIVYLLYFVPPIKVEEPEEPKSEVEKQLEEMEKFREENTEPLTEEEIQEQLEDMEDFRGDTRPLTEEEIQEQLKEMEEFRNNQQ